MKRALFLLCFLFALAEAALALSYSTPEESFAQSVALCAGAFAKDHEGRSPAAWSDLQPYFHRPIDEVFPHILPTRRYAFLAQPLHLPPPHDGELVIIGRRPFRDARLYTNWYGSVSHGYREPGRYIIYRAGEGSFQASYEEEAVVQQAFRGSESLLPEPDSEPDRSPAISVRLKSLVTPAILATIPIFFFARFVRRRLAIPPGPRPQRRSKRTFSSP